MKINENVNGSLNVTQLFIGVKALRIKITILSMINLVQIKIHSLLYNKATIKPKIKIWTLQNSWIEKCHAWKELFSQRLIVVVGIFIIRFLVYFLLNIFLFYVLYSIQYLSLYSCTISLSTPNFLFMFSFDGFPMFYWFASVLDFAIPVPLPQKNLLYAINMLSEFIFFVNYFFFLNLK